MGQSLNLPLKTWAGRTGDDPVSDSCSNGGNTEAA